MKRTAILFLLLAACEDDRAAASMAVIGAPGSADGLFATPRGVAADPRGFVYAVDKSARIQKFDARGRFVCGWATPECDKGRPTGVTVDDEGFVWVADTHYHRVLKYTASGELVFQFGAYGRAPGEFIYPTCVAVKGPWVVVSEFGTSDTGSNDRIQLFDRAGKFVRAWGSYGEEPGQFKRPQSLGLTRERIYVCDAANHRIQIFDYEGTLQGIWGRLGKGEGELSYPYGLALGPDGSLYVAEYGNHRVQRFGADGRPMGCRGRWGAAPGMLDTPWAVALIGDRLIIADSNNHRLQAWPLSLWGS